LDLGENPRPAVGHQFADRCFRAALERALPGLA
jgi:hypothetical protein